MATREVLIRANFILTNFHRRIVAIELHTTGTRAIPTSPAQHSFLSSQMSSNGHLALVGEKLAQGS